MTAVLFPAKAGPASAVRAEGVRAGYQGIEVLRHVTFTLAPGTLAVLVGANGSGKSTLLGTISGFVALTGGDLFIGPRRISGLTPPEVARQGVSRTLQRPTLIPTLSVTENVMLGGWPRPGEDPLVALMPARWRPAEQVLGERARELIARSGLHAKADAPASTLSAGEIRRVAFARAVLGGGPVFLFDELLTGVSTAERRVLVAQLVALAAQGATVLCAEHHRDEMAAAGAQVLELRDGCVGEDAPR